MNFFSLLLMLISFQHKSENNVYSKEDITYYFDYAVTKQWQLELKGERTFILTYKKKDSRFKKANTFNFLGTWDNRNDTISLTTSSSVSDVCYFKNVKYILSGSGLKLIGTNLCLPTDFQVGNRFTVKI